MSTSTETVTLIPQGYKSIEDVRPELQALLADKHQEGNLVFVGVPWYKLEDTRVEEGDHVTWFDGGSEPLGLKLGDRQFTCFRVVQTENGLFKPGWAQSKAQELDVPLVNDVGSGKVSTHDRNGMIPDGHYHKDLSREGIEELLAKQGIPSFATGDWRKDPDGAPAGATLLAHEDEACLTARSVCNVVPRPFTLIEMGKGSTQVVTCHDV